MKTETRGTLQAGLLAALIFLPFLGASYLMEGEESFSAEIAREMLVSGDFIRPTFDFMEVWERPPLFAWMQSLSLYFFGENAFAARLPNALCGILTLLLLYRMGARLYNHRFGLVWAGVFVSGLLPMLLFRSGVEAPWSGLLIFLGLVHLIFFYWNHQGRAFPLRWPSGWYLYTGGIFAGLAALLRGPEAFVLLAIVFGVYWLYKNLRFYISVQQFLLFFALGLIIPLIWLSIDGIFNGPDATMAIPAYQLHLFAVAPEGQRQFWGFYFIILLLGCLPGSLFMLRLFIQPRLRRATKESFEQRDFRRWMKMFFWTVLVLSTLRSAKAPHHAFAAFFPVTFLAAYAVHHMVEGSKKLERWMGHAMIASGAIYLVIAALWAWSASPGGAGDSLQTGGLFSSLSLRAAIPCLLLILLGGMAWRKFRENALEKGILFLLAAFTAYGFAASTLLLPPSVDNTAGAAVKFARSRAGEDCYVFPYGLNPANTLFYARKKSSSHPKSSDPEWLLHGDTDKTVYLIAKTAAAGTLSEYPHLEELYREGDFIFYKRIK